MPNIAELRELYDTADSFAREVSELRSEVPIPAHNELRYAGHHLLQSISDDGVVTNEDPFRKAKNHCERAMYEAAEAGIMHILEAIAEFREAYKSTVVREVVPDFQERIVRAKNARNVIIKGRSDRESVEEHVSTYMEVFRDLSETLDILDASRDDLNAKKEAQDSNRRKGVIAALGTLLGMLFIVWRIIAGS